MRFMTFVGASLVVCAVLLIVDAVTAERSPLVAPDAVARWLAPIGLEPATNSDAGASKSLARALTDEDGEPQDRFEQLMTALLGSGQPRALAGLALGEEPIEIAHLLIEEMTEDELIDTVASLSAYPEDELRRYGNVRGFVRRLSRIALEEPGVEDDGSKWYEPFVYPHDVEFSHEQDLSADNSTRFPQTSFPNASDKIYAVFPTSTYGMQNVLVRWRRTDQPSLILLDRYPVLIDDANSYVWLRFPEGWPDGTYHVSIFTDGEKPKPLAAGEYAINSTPPPATPAPEPVESEGA